jgi:mannose-6-phosphate isomerase-like protein (cupin superfamily)
MAVENIKTKYGKIRYFETKEASFNIETVLPKKKIPKFYLKRNTAHVIILEGILNSPRGKLKKGDFIKIKPKQKFWLENKTNKTAKFLSVDVPKIKDSDIVWLEK